MTKGEANILFEKLQYEFDLTEAEANKFISELARGVVDPKNKNTVVKK